MPTTYGNDIVYCLKSHCGVRGYCRQKWVLQVQIICKFSNERTCKRNKDVQGLSCGFEVYKGHGLSSNVHYIVQTLTDVLHQRYHPALYMQNQERIWKYHCHLGVQWNDWS